jgi:hypothetical protein
LVIIAEALVVLASAPPVDSVEAASSAAASP